MSFIFSREAAVEGPGNDCPTRYRRRNHGNILLVANYKASVGYAWWLMETFWIEISKLFTKQGRKVFLIYPLLDAVPERIKQAPLLIMEHDFSDRTRSSTAALKKLIRENSIRSLYLTDCRYLDIRYLRLRIWGIRAIVLHDHTPGERPPVPIGKKLLKKALHSLRLLSCDSYIGVSKFVYNRFIFTGCIPRKKCSFVLNGIEPIVIYEKYKHYANEQFGIPHGSKIIVSTGRATFYKGIDFLIKCADALINEKRDDRAYFLHCGDGPDLDAFLEMVRKYNLENRFIFAGRRDDVPLILQSCDIGIQASEGEAFSLSILEYMSAGLATLAPHHCGNGEALENGKTGFLYPPRDKAFVVELLHALIRNNELCKRIGSMAAQAVKEHFTIERTTRELLALSAENL